ncbi:MAG: DUF1343 domain-containing protein [bacterium]
MVKSVACGIGIVLVALCLSVHAASQAVSPVVHLGIDRLEQGGFKGLDGKKVGLVVNLASVDSQGRSTIDVLRNALGARLIALFGPEHGLDGKARAGRYVKSYTDKRTGLPVYSLYDRTRKPTPQMLQGLDCLVYDVQDLGCRSYTYVSTLGLVMEAAAELNKEVIVLDRPNPLGGLRMEGPRLNPKFRTFVGMFDIPYVYGLTIGELAQWINKHHLKKSCKLTVMPMDGWRREMTWQDTGLRWLPTSPNIPRVESVFGYVATGLLGEIGVVNGANDLLPFELIAAEGLDGAGFSSKMNSFGFRGVQFEPHSFRPSSGKYRSVRFSGARLKIDPKAEANLTAIPFYAFPLLKKRFPKRKFFANRTKEPVIMFDKINGGDYPRLALQREESPEKIIASWTPGVKKWSAERQPFLMYP